MLDIRQSSNYIKYLENTGWVVEEKNDIYYFIKKFPFIGSVIKIQRPEILDYSYIYKLANKHKAFQIIVEPISSSNFKVLTSTGFKISKNPYLPTKTLQLNLTKGQDKLIYNMKKDCRSALKKNDNLRFMIYDLKNINEFRIVWKQSVPLKRYVPSLSNLKSLKKSFGKDCLLITDQGKLAGGVFLISGKYAYYWFAFTGKKGRKNQIQYAIVWKAILWAKKKGCKLFDFEGIYDSRFPNESWKGFTHFKKSFGGKEITYPGTFIKTNIFRVFK